MHQPKYFTSNFFINEIFSVEKFPNYGISMNGYSKSRFIIQNIHLYGRTYIASLTGTMIIVQINIHHHSKLFTTGRARVNTERNVIKCVGSR